jgi:hypothetical protein
METSLEYLAVGLLIVALLLVSYSMAETITSSLVTTYEEQLYTVAERVIDKIVLTPGYPTDWGTNISVTADNLQDFGLALYGSRKPYTVDPDKVMRLANLSTLPNPLLLNTSRLAELLSLKEGYGFHLRMIPMLIINVTPTSYYNYRTYIFPSVFNIYVANYYGLGIPNAYVTGMYAIVRVKPGASEANVEVKNILSKSALTDAVGFCVLDYTEELTNYFSSGENVDKWFYAFLIVRAEWQGFVSVTGYAATAQGGVPAEGYIIGNYVFVDKNIENVVIVRRGRNAGAVQVKDDLLQAVPEYQELLNFTTVVWCRDSTGNFRNDDPLCNNAGRVLPSAKQWYLVGYIKYVEPLSSHIFIFATFKGNPVAIVVSRIPNIDIYYGSSRAKPANSVTLRRVCTIYSYPYIVELTVWREVEGYP